MATHEPVAVGQAPHRAAGRIGLIGDLAHDLFDDVLDRDDAGRAPVLVDDDGELGALPLQVGEKVVEGLGFRNQRSRAHKAVEVGLHALTHHQLDQLVDVNDPLDPVLILVLGDHQARVAGVHAAPQGGLGVLGHVDRDTAGIGVITCRASCSCR